jgi:hypothetical protein
MNEPFRLTLHRARPVSDGVARAEAFHRDAMGLEPPASGLPRLEKPRGHAGNAAFPAHLDACGLPRPGWRGRAVQGWRRVFFHDPGGSVIEGHAVALAPKPDLNQGSVTNPS